MYVKYFRNVLLDASQHPAHHSSLHFIQLLAVAKSTDIRAYGIDAVLTPVIADLKLLANKVYYCSTLYIIMLKYESECCFKQTHCNILKHPNHF